MRAWTDDDVLYWWRMGKDTQQIADQLNRGAFRSRQFAAYRGMMVQVPALESEVYNALHRAREKERAARYDVAV